MAEISDELLMAYADDALDPSVRTIVEAALREDPRYREKVDKFRATRDPVRAAFQQDQGLAGLGPLIDRLRGDDVPLETAATTSYSRRVVPLSNVRATYASRFRHHLPAAMAASVALLVGATLGWLAHPVPVTSPVALDLIGFRDGRLQAQGPLRELLEGVSSGVSVGAKTAADEAWTLTATFTFASSSRTPCRRYELVSDGTSRFAGYACRNGQGQWLVHAHSSVVPKGLSSKNYVTAAGEPDAALEAAIRATMDG